MNHSVYHYLQAIRALRAGTGGDLRVSQYIMQYALDHNLFVAEDDHMNLFLEKPASLGREEEPVVLIHGQSDLAGAMIIRLISDEDLSLPALEINFSQNKDYVFGKQARERRQMRTGYILNLDPEPNAEVTAFCAGGVRLDFETRVIRERIRDGFIPVQVTVDGLRGGFSAEDIFHGRGNAIKLLGEFLFKWYNYSFDSRLVSINGGTQFNTIASSCTARLWIPAHQGGDISRGTWWYGEDIAKKFGSSESEARIHIEYPQNIRAEEWAPMCSDASGRILSFLNISPNGIINMSPDEVDLVETCSSMGVVETTQDVWKLSASLRSFSDENKESVRNKFELFADMNRIDHAAVGSFPALKTLTLHKLPDKEHISEESAENVYDEMIGMIRSAADFL